MSQFKKFLAITVPISIILVIMSFIGKSEIWITIGALSLMYAIVGGII